MVKSGKKSYMEGLLIEVAGRFARTPFGDQALGPGRVRRPRGLCPRCSQVVALMDDGTVMKHRDAGKMTCPGWGMQHERG